MRTQIDIRTMADIMTAIDHYQSLLWNLPQLDIQQHERLKQYWDSLFPKGAYDQFHITQWETINMHIVRQVWSNTSGGWQGIGGAAMTAAHTTIIENELMGFIVVYYAGKIAYIAEMDDKLKPFREQGYKTLPGVRTAKTALTLVYHNRF